ncbi:MAG: hypothetical protein IAG13_27355 [Deltaproteobacteria bacterium]|nr:hypothetical protein [Nannocystaceae bacterium]
MLAPLACADESGGRPEVGIDPPSFSELAPGLVVPGSTLVIRGAGFFDPSVADTTLVLTGTFAGQASTVELPTTFVDVDELRVELLPELLGRFPGGEGELIGTAQLRVDYRPEATQVGSAPLPTTLVVASSLQPVLGDLQLGGVVHVNDPIPVEGEGFLLGGGEGESVAVIEGCFVAIGADACVPVGPVEVPLVPDAPFERTRASFAFAPSIAGIQPGSFSGTVALRNHHAAGPTRDGDDALDVAYELIPTAITGVATSSGTGSGTGASLGQFIDIEGGGFVGGEDGLTTLVLDGNYTQDGASEGAPVMLELVPEFESGQRVRYIVNEDDGLGAAIDVRLDTGVFDGTMTPVVAYGGDELVGDATPLSFSILPVKQVVWVRFESSYVESLRGFGLRALDSMIRARILEVLRRDYETINIEFREEEPTDFELFAILDIAGPDPNGLGLLGYDNTNGKDIDNARLFDHIGGVNALTQQDGFPGFGGVFIESLFAFSHHPPGGKQQDVASHLFDDIFDPFRPDHGTPFSSADLGMGEVPALTSGGGCPTDDRRLQAACAVWVLGSMIGTTVSHENGHALGLADPLGTRFHNLGDAPNRLMDAGGARTLEERAELMGEGPARFCDDEYEYLRGILPTSEPATTVARPFC